MRAGAPSAVILFQQHPRIFARGVQLEFKILCSQGREVTLALSHGEHLIGVFVIIPHKVVGENFPLRSIGEEALQPERAREDGLVVRHAPLPQLRLYVRRRFLN